MAIAYRSSTTATATADEWISIGLPSGCTSGDVLVFQTVMQEGNEGASSLLSTLVGDGPSFTNVLPTSLGSLINFYSELYTFRHKITPEAVTGYGKRLFYTSVYRLADGSEPGTFSFFFKSGASPPSLSTPFDYCSAHMLCYSGVTAVGSDINFEWYDPNTAPIGTGRSSGTTWDAGALTCSSTQALLELGFTVAASSASMTPPSGLTERTDTWQTGSGFLMTAADKIPGDSASHTFTSSVAGTRGNLLSMTLGPASPFVPQIYRRN